MEKAIGIEGNGIKGNGIEGNGRERIGKYKVLRTLGEGGEGCVCLAQDTELNRLVAVKQMRKDETQEQLRREAAFLQKLRHRMLPVVYDLLWAGAWYLVMEYIEGISLHNYIQKHGRVKEAQGRLWADQLLELLSYFHTRQPPVIYQDLKPDNIMVCPDGSLKLVDFGAACDRAYGGDAAYRIAASAGYAAPEQRGRTGVPYADERSDIYAFGRVMYYVLTGADPAYPPYASLPITSYAPELGRQMERVILQCMQEDPARRCQVAAQVQRSLCGGARRGIMHGGSAWRGTAGVFHRLKDRRERRFIRKIEKSVFLTEQKSSDLTVL